MPDGSVAGAPRRAKLLAFADSFMQAMHERLVDWGLCWLRGGGCDVDAARPDIRRVNNKLKEEAVWMETTTSYREADPVFDRRDWTQPEIESAGRLHGRINGLPIQRSLVLQVFYFEEDAATFHELPAPQQDRRIADLTHWRGRPLGVNARIDDHNVSAYDHVPHIVPEAFLPIRHRAIRELIARERGLPYIAKPQQAETTCCRNMLTDPGE